MLDTIQKTKRSNYSVNKYLLRAYSVQCTVLDTGNNGVNKTDKNICLPAAYILVRGESIKSKIYSVSDDNNT